MEIVSFAHYGYEGEIVKIEADLRRGIPAMDIVGLPDGAVREARERIRAAIRNSGLEFPRDRILINLSPADLKKEGSSFDLPMALAVLVAAEPALRDIQEESEHTIMILGELELSGTVRPVRGILSAVSRGLDEGIRHFIVPAQNQEEAAIRREAIIFGVSSLSEAIHQLSAIVSTSQTADSYKRKPASQWNADRFSISPSHGYEDIKGQSKLVRALEIAAAGGHHLLVYGPPGCGKTLALKRFPVLMPDLDDETAVTLTRIYSIAGILSEKSGNITKHSAGITVQASDMLIRQAPFRMPHQNASLEGIIGGGRRCTPGEISLAHGGVLFLDEATLFRSSVLQALRAPLETGAVTVSRAGKAVLFPARFQLLMAMNPCPCGNFGVPGRFCTCTPEMIDAHWKRLTAPLLDRIDLRIAIGIPSASELTECKTFSTQELRKEIGQARKRQWNRNTKEIGASAWLNAYLDASTIPNVCMLTPVVKDVFLRAMEVAGFSGRGEHGILKVARTIADLAGSEDIQEDHILEAIQLRRWNTMVPDFL